jgi:tryptophanyl-tRNA synthetase
MSSVITGLQPTGSLHIGNLVTAIMPLVELQREHECVLFVADLHAMTIPYKPAELRTRILELVRIYLAAGIDPQKSLIFVQSEVAQHTELAWILGTQLPMAELERMTQYKEKADQHKKLNFGIFAYPVLMAADILLYGADLVPVGQDQAQHVELTRIAARKFNKAFGETFKLPRAQVNTAARIIGLDGKGKMSKSLGNTLDLLDSPEILRKKIRKAVVNPARPKTFEGQRPITIFEWHDQQFASDETKRLSKECHVEDRNCEAYKEHVAKNIATFLAPLQKKHAELVAKGDEFILEILRANAQKARERAEKTMHEVRSAVGLNATR